MVFLPLLCSMVYALHAAPLARRMVDMTYTFDETTLHLPFVKGFRLDVVVNETFGDTGAWILAEEYSGAIHIGTHMDAPAHFTKRGLTVDQIPVHHLVAPAAVIDITAKAELDPDAEATVEDLLNWEAVTGQSLNETIILLKFGWGRKWNNAVEFFGLAEADSNDVESKTRDEVEPGFHSNTETSSFNLVLPELHYPGLAPEAATWLVENRNIYGLGTEAVSFDRGTSRDYLVHQVLLGNGIYGLENVANVDKIPIYGAKLYVFPAKMENAGGAPTRIIATYPEVIFDTLSQTT